jgi:hypothetical protein
MFHHVCSKFVLGAWTGRRTNERFWMFLLQRTCRSYRW